MKAWQIECETMKKGLPVVLEADEQGWDYCEEVGANENKAASLRWHSCVPGSAAVEHCIVAAIQDTENMGYDVTEAEKFIEEGMRAYDNGDSATMCMLNARISHLLNIAPKIPSHPYWGYTQYESFEQMASKSVLPVIGFSGSREELGCLNRIGWEAQICAGALGTALEGYTTENLEKVFGNIEYYVRTPNTYNDDITYEIAFLYALKNAGKNLKSSDIAEQWVALIPSGWSAEEIALQNLRLGVYPPESGRLNNPYREWIGAQMRGAVCGMVSPGNAYEAARLAFMDGQVSHHNNGILGEVFNAVLTSMAYVKTDVREILETAINSIPNDSEYYSVVKYAWDCCHESSNWKDASSKCIEKYGRYNWIHAYPNACGEVIALFFGNGVFDKTMNIIAMYGWDVDCNAAQIATVVAIANRKAIDSKWSAPIGDLLYTYMRNLKQVTITGLAAMTTDLSIV